MFKIRWVQTSGCFLSSLELWWVSHIEPLSTAAPNNFFLSVHLYRCGQCFPAFWRKKLNHPPAVMPAYLKQYQSTDRSGTTRTSSITTINTWDTSSLHQISLSHLSFSSEHLSTPLLNLPSTTLNFYPHYSNPSSTTPTSCEYIRSGERVTVECADREIDGV